MSSDGDETTSSDADDDDDFTSVPSVAELGIGVRAHRAASTRRESGIIPVISISVLTHAAAVFAALTVYVIGNARGPQVTVATGSGASAQAAVVDRESNLAEPVELPTVSVSSEDVATPAKTTTMPPPPLAAADNATSELSARPESWPGPAPDIAADVPNASAQLGFPSSASIAVPSTLGRRPPIAEHADSTDVAGDGIAAGPPKPASGNRPPRYPPDALRHRIEGTVVLSVEVRPSGDVGSVQLARSSGHASLDDAALQAVRAWRFRPAMDATGAVVPTSTIVTLPIEFVWRPAKS